MATYQLCVVCEREVYTFVGALPVCRDHYEAWRREADKLYEAGPADVSQGEIFQMFQQANLLRASQRELAAMIDGKMAEREQAAEPPAEDAPAERPEPEILPNWNLYLVSGLAYLGENHPSYREDDDIAQTVIWCAFVIADTPLAALETAKPQFDYEVPERAYEDRRLTPSPMEVAPGMRIPASTGERYVLANFALRKAENQEEEG